MKPKAAKAFAHFLALALLIPGAVGAQTAGSTVTGTITNPSGAVVPNASVSVRNLGTGQSVESQTDAGGVYTVADLVPGEYEISASADGLATQAAKVTLTAGAKETLNLALGAKSGAPAPPSLSDLGINPDQAKGNAVEQHRLDKRSHMLRTHQRLGLITVAPLLATLLTANGAAGRRGSASGRELHAALGSVTAGMYLTTASFAIFAPKEPGVPVRGPIRLHKALAWIHGPGMILVPILGALAYEQRSKGERIHGLARAHAPVAIVTSAAYGLAILSVSIKF